MPSQYFAIMFMILSMVSLTVGGTLAKTLFPVLGANGTTFLRLGISALILLAVRRPWRAKMDAKMWRWAALYGAILGTMNLTFYLAIQRLPIGLAIGIEFLGPLAVALMLSRTITDLLWAFLALLGIVLILPIQQSTHADPTGVAYALIAAACWAAYILAGKKIGRLMPTANATAYGIAFAALFVLPFGGDQATQLVDHSELILSAVGVGLLSSAIPYTLEMMAMKSLDSRSFGIILSLEPAIGALSAYALISEQLTPLQIAAIFCVMAASIGNILASRRRPQNELVG